MPSPFDYVRAINAKSAIDTSSLDKDYVPYIVNKAMSYYPDTIGVANLLNECWSMPKRAQFDVYMQAVRQKRRYTPWIKPDRSADIQIISDFYKYSRAKAEEALDILTSDQIAELKKLLKDGVVYDRNIHRGDPQKT